jgi:hypothetical protein
MVEMEASFARGAHAVLGWPIDDVISTTAARGGKSTGQPDLQVFVELIRRVDNEEPIDRLETTLRRDPSLAFKLLRYINSPAFGLRVEISSFSHAIMMLGYQRLKRWLALLLATASKDVNLKPVMFAAVRRGLLMEELVRGSGDEEMRNYYSVLRLDASFPLGLPQEYGIYGGVFGDIGSLWGLDDIDGSMGPVDDGFHVRSSVGVSLFVDTPFAPLRFNYAVPIQREDYDVVERFRFTVQTRF